VSELEVRLELRTPRVPEGEDPELVSTLRNRGSRPLGLTLWWTRRLQIRDAAGALVEPGPGPTLPCGVAEEVTILAPGAALERAEAWSCTQPAGAPSGVGWSYQLAPGRYTLSLVYESPPPHGFTQHPPGQEVWRGRAVSNEVELEVTGRRGWWS